jgi:hypothetical protein
MFDLPWFSRGGEGRGGEGGASGFVSSQILAVANDVVAQYGRSSPPGRDAPYVGYGAKPFRVSCA